MSAEPTSSLREELQQLEAQLDAEVASRTRVAKTARLVSVTLCCCILFFLFLGVSYLSTQFTKEHFTRNLNEEMAILSPLALKELSAMGQNLAPVYASEAQKQLSKLMPKISEVFEDELNKLSTEIAFRTHDKLQSTQETLSREVQKALYASYPDLEKTANQEKLKRKLRSVVEKSVETGLLDFEKRFRKDVDQVIDTLLSFNITSEGETEIELRKEFLCLWLRLLELEVRAL